MLCAVPYTILFIYHLSSRRSRNVAVTKQPLDETDGDTVKRKVHDNEDKWGLSSGDDRDVQVQIAVIVSNI